MENLIIRNVKKEDIPKIVDIQINGWKTAYRGIIDDEYLENLDSEYDLKVKKMQKNYMNNGFVVVELNNQVVAFCRYIYDNSNSPEIIDADCELSVLYVESNLKNKGIGTALFKYVINEFKKQNKTCMVIWCLKDNVIGNRFYTKMGGTIVSEKAITKGNKEYKEVCFLYNI